MDGSIRLPGRDRKALLDVYRRGSDPEQRLRAHILLLLDDGVAWAVITAVLYTSTTTVSRWKKRYQAGGVAAIAGRVAGPGVVGGPGLAMGHRPVPDRLPVRPEPVVL
jgi:hypothetical protein